jgi:hypothetical protein
VELAQLAAMEQGPLLSAVRNFHDELKLQAKLLSRSDLFLDSYRVPTADTLAVALAGMDISGVTPLLNESNGHIDWLKSMGEVQTPWARFDNEARSVRAFAELHSIGAAVKFGAGFDPRMVAALRSNLGDWRDVMTFPNDILLEPLHRTELYLERGFNPDLTDFPEEAFCDGLSSAGDEVSYLNAVDLGSFIPDDASPEESATLKRTEFGYAVLMRFERSLRVFINNKMTEKHGADWPKKRLSPKDYEAWEDKAEKSKSAGRPLEFLIEAADFTDYEGIICRRDDFRNVFAAFFGRPESIRECFNRLRPLRLATMHSRLLTKEDVLYIVSECTRVMQAIK